MSPRGFALPGWTYSYVFAAAVFVLILVVTGSGGVSTFTSALSLAPYLVLVALGQMLVIASGPGNIDLSVASVVTLSGYVAIAVSTSTGSALLGVVAAIGTGVATALVSVLAITLVAVPPIVATLASSLIVTSITLSVSNGFAGTADDALRAFVNAKVVGIPWLAIIVLAIAVIVALILAHTVYGRRLLASGQARGAADYARLRPARVISTTYIVSGALAGLTGALLSAYIAPSPELGTSYLLDSIAVVVIGGTLITGGRALPAGVWGGALFFVLLDSLLNLVGWSLAGQNILKGLLILAVLVLAGGAVGRARKGTTAAEGRAAPPAAAQETASV